MSHFSQADFERLLQLRTSLRHFLRRSERHSKAEGITPAQHQLMLAIRGHPEPGGPKISDVAGYLLLRHHSAVGLIDRAVASGLVRRNQDPENGSVVRLSLTPGGIEKLDRLADAHRDELKHLAPTMQTLLDALTSSPELEALTSAPSGTRQLLDLQEGAAGQGPE